MSVEVKKQKKQLKGPKKGKKFGTRPVVDNAQGSSLPTGSGGSHAVANQWQATTQQQNWLRYYMDPAEKETWGNAYQSAIKAGYSENYASRILSDKIALQWVQQARNIMRLNPEHLKSALNDIISNKYEKASDRIAAIKLLGIDQGMFVQKSIMGHVNIEDMVKDLE